ncbi:MAG: radical SAM protein [Deltaproteobacteria bacterium]|nr:MAG: radical SAM protein [Deltaproteobacteria bacterium]
MAGYEQGPIRPPSEAFSLLVRVSRNCPWNRCAFCPVYKGKKFSLRSVDEVLADLDEMKKEFGTAPRTVFLQDANPLLTKPDDFVRIIEGIRERFPNVERITAYARSHTIVRRRPEDLARMRKAGLDRLHVGMESGCDEVLELVNKGTTRDEQIEAGRRAKEAGFELSEYVMPGLGGRRLSEKHADDTASALEAIQPDFVRLRTTAVIPGTPLAELQEKGEFEPLGEVELVAEIERMLRGMKNVHTRLESDHMLNLLMELRGDLPREHERLLGICREFLQLPERLRGKFILARRLGWMGSLRQLDQVALDPEIERVWTELEKRGTDPEQFFADMRKRAV